LNSVKDKNLLNFIKKNQTLVNIALLSKDVDFNFPHRISVRNIREKILKDIEDEKNRLEREKLANIELLKKKNEEDNKNKKLNYENYFEIDSNCNLILIVFILI
jgi:hypothetical protein